MGFTTWVAGGAKSLSGWLVNALLRSMWWVVVVPIGMIFITAQALLDLAWALVRTCAGALGLRLPPSIDAAWVAWAALIGSCAAVAAPFMAVWCALDLALAPLRLCAEALGVRLLHPSPFADQLWLGPPPWRALLGLVRGDAEPVPDRVYRATREVVLDPVVTEVLVYWLTSLAITGGIGVFGPASTGKEARMHHGEYFGAFRAGAIGAWLALVAEGTLCLLVTWALRAAVREGSLGGGPTPRARALACVAYHATLQSYLALVMALIAAQGFALFASMFGGGGGGDGAPSGRAWVVSLRAASGLALLWPLALVGFSVIAILLVNYAARLDGLRGAAEHAPAAAGPAQSATPAAWPKNPGKDVGAATGQLQNASAAAGEAAAGKQGPPAGAMQPLGCSTVAPGSPQPADSSGVAAGRACALRSCMVQGFLFFLGIFFTFPLFMIDSWPDAAAAALGSPRLTPVAKYLRFDAAAYALGTNSPGVATVASVCALIVGGCQLLVAALLVRVGGPGRAPAGGAGFAAQLHSDFKEAMERYKLHMMALGALSLTTSSWLGTLPWVLACRSQAAAMASLTLFNVSHAFVVWVLAVRLQAWDLGRLRATAAPRVHPGAAAV